MNFTKSPDHIIHAATGWAMHEDAAAVPTVVSDADLNQLSWELMTLLRKRGIVGKDFNPDDPTSYEQVYNAINDMITTSLQNQDHKNSVRCVITSTVSLTGTVTSAVSDNITLTNGDPVLYAPTTASTAAGVYVYNTAGAWTRRADANEPIELTSGMQVVVEGGALYQDSLWTLTTDGAISLGTTPILFQCTGGVVLTSTNDLTFADNSKRPASTSWIRGAMSAIATAAGFAFSAAENGYLKLPSWLGGIIFQWGIATTGGTGQAVFTLPITFPNAIYSANASYFVNGLVPNFCSLYSLAYSNSAISAIVYNTSGAGVPSAQVRFISVGR